jgi:hypothetical protein
LLLFLDIGNMTLIEKLKSIKSNNQYWINQLTSDEIAELLTLTNFLPNDTAINLRKIYVINGYTEIQLCPVCGKAILKIDYDKNKLKAFCSNVCKMSIDGKKITSDKSKKALIEKYGKDFFKIIGEMSQNKHSDEIRMIKEKRIKTNIERFGVENTFQSDEKKRKIKNTNYERYGDEYYIKTDEFREKSEKTCIEKYDSTNPMTNIDIKNKVILTKRDNYWDTFNILLNKKFIEPNFTKDDYINMKIGDLVEFKCLKCDKNFKFEIISGQGLEVKDITCPNHKYSSQPEFEIIDFLSKLLPNTIIEQNKRFYYDKNRFHEVDIFLPEYNIGIEHHGLYWHSDIFHHKNYHRDKHLFFKAIGVDLVQIFENEWLNSQDIVKSILRVKLGVLDGRIFARKCEIREIDNQLYRKFCELNHIQGYCRAKIRIGLFYKEELVQIMSFSKSRFNKKYSWENIRTCTKLNIIVVGGFSRMLKYFKTNYTGSIITYVDCRYFNGSGYIENGFTVVEHSMPNYFYFKTKNIIYSRNMFQKHKLKDILPIFDEKITEYENMLNNGYLRIFDAGNLVLVG